MNHAGRRGQFFLIGALIVASLLTAIVLFEESGDIVTPNIEPTRSLYDQAVQEFPRAANIGVSENASGTMVQRRVQSYLGFQSTAFDGHALDDEVYGYVGIPRRDGVDMVVINMLPRSMDDVTVTLDGTTKTIDTVPGGTVERLRFDAVADRFDVRFAFSADQAYEHTRRVSRDAAFGLYRISVSGEQQRWRTVETY